MERRKGFTLVELLAVIAILAILVIIALPNVINMYTKAKKGTFVTEAQNIIKEASNKYVQESTSGKTLDLVSNDVNSLNLTGEKMKYQVRLDSRGMVTGYIISNDNYCISSNKQYDKLTTDDVSEECSYEELNNIAGTLLKEFYSKAGRSAKDLVSSIVFYSDGRTIDNAEKYDVSEAQDNSIIMYVTNASEDTSLLDLTIVADGKIMFPEDSSGLFNFRTEYPCGYYAVNLSKLEFNSAIDTSKVINMSSMFRGVKTDIIDLADFNTVNVIDMSNLFYNSQVKEIIGLNKLNTSNLKDISYMFSDNYNLSSIDMTGFNTENVENMAAAFNSSSILEIKGLNTLNTSKVTNMSHTFSSQKVNRLDLSNFNTSNVTNMSGMFMGCGSSEIIGLNKLNTSNVIDMSDMFYGTKLSVIDLKGFDTSKVIRMSRMFSGAKTDKIDLSTFNTGNVTTMSEMFSATQVNSLDLSSFDTSNVTNMGSMFWNKYILEIKGLNKFNTKNVTIMSYMFRDSKVSNLDVTSFNTSKVTTMYGLFENSNISNIDVSNFDTRNVTKMASMFSGSAFSEIRGLNIFNTSKVTDMGSMFYDTKNLKVIDLSSFDLSNLTFSYAMFNKTLATTGYAKDTATATKLNNISGKPTTLTFVVK